MSTTPLYRTSPLKHERRPQAEIAALEEAILAVCQHALGLTLTVEESERDGLLAMVNGWRS